MPFIPSYTAGQPFTEGSDNPINLVRMYTSEEDHFSLEWFMNVITGYAYILNSFHLPLVLCSPPRTLFFALILISSIHSTCEGYLHLGSIDSHSALITIEIPETQLAPSFPSPPTSPEGNPLIRATSLPNTSSKSSGSPLRASDSKIRSPEKAKLTARGGRLVNFLSFQRTYSSPTVQMSTLNNPPSSPISTPPQSPQRFHGSPSLPLPPPVPTTQFKCYLHRSPTNDHKFWFVLSCPSLSSKAQITFTTILQNIQWLLNHWIDNPSYTFRTCCYECFDMPTFVRSKTANCPLSQADCMRAIRGLEYAFFSSLPSLPPSLPPTLLFIIFMHSCRTMECQKPTCKKAIDISYLVPDLSLPLTLERPVDSNELTPVSLFPLFFFLVCLRIRGQVANVCVGYEIRQGWLRRHIQTFDGWEGGGDKSSPSRSRRGH